MYIVTKTKNDDLFTPNMKYFDLKKFSNSKANHPVALTNPQILKNLYFVDF